MTSWYCDSLNYIAFDSTQYSYLGNREGNARYMHDWSPHMAVYGWTYNGQYDTSYEYINSFENKGYYAFRRTIKSYDPNDSLLSSLWQFNDTLHHIWVNSLQQINLLDANKNNIQTTDQYWDESRNIWFDSVKSERVFDTYNNKISDTTFSKGRNAYNWAYLYANEYKYSLTGQLLENTYWQWYSMWLTEDKDVYYYNTANKIDSVLTYILNSSGVWQESSSAIFTYDATYRILSLDWGSSTQYNYSYPDSNTEIIDTKFGIGPGSWINDNLYTLTFNKDHKTIEKIRAIWDDSAHQYFKYLKTTNSYDANGNVVQSVDTTWDRKSNSWRQQAGDNMMRFYYETYTGLNDVKKPACKLNLYPDPASIYLNVQLINIRDIQVTFAIYDFSGRLWRQWSIQAYGNYEAEIPVIDLPVGSYILIARAKNVQVGEQFSVAH
ncbi:MAG: T9SS type A sorting domain-containing protein [Bacteroidetes bacterium]|nr:T9SS type A sorting domain-containing protein [Bacteroidota bacterium]